MISTKPPAGMRDFLPLELARREHALKAIRTAYERHHFQPIETPALERMETLSGKYGEEGDQLIFKVLKRGEKLTEAIEASPVVPRVLSDMGLRYDLTVPLCRVVAEYQNELPTVFKCYQLRPVWRADRPAKGRFREFYQCDVDVIGTASLLAEVEVITAAGEALTGLGLTDFKVRINDRRLLTQITRHAGIPDDSAENTLVSLDKLDKIGVDGVRAELKERGLAPMAIERLFALMDACLQGPQQPRQRLEVLARLLDSDEARPVLDDLGQILGLLGEAGLGESALIFDPTLVRGLSYYTGPIYELALEGYSGSVGGGGRYDELVGMFLGRSVPACGISLGIERLLMIMEQRGLFAGVSPRCDVFVVRFPDVPPSLSLRLASRMREAGLVVDVACEPIRLKKQLAQGEKMGARAALIAGPDEVAQGTVVLKNLRTSEQVVVSEDQAVDMLCRGWLDDGRSAGD